MHRLSVRLDLSKLVLDPAEARRTAGSLGSTRPNKNAKGKAASSTPTPLPSLPVLGGPTALVGRESAEAYLQECASGESVSQYAEAATIIAAAGSTLREQGAGAAAAIWLAVAEEKSLSESSELSIAKMYDRLQRRVGSLRADRSVDADKKTLAIGWMLLMTSLASVSKGLGVDGRTGQRDRPKSLGIEDDPVHLQAPTSKATLLPRIIRGILRFASQHQTLYTMAFEALTAWLSPSVVSLSVVRTTLSAVPELDELLSVPPTAISPDALAFLMNMEARWGSKFFGHDTVNLVTCGWIVREGSSSHSPHLATEGNVQLMSMVLTRGATSHAPELHPAWQALLARRDVGLYSRLMRSVIMGQLAQGSDGQRAAALVLWGAMVALLCGVEVEGVAAATDDNTFATLGEKEAFGLALVLLNRYMCGLLLDTVTAKSSPLNELGKRTLSLYVRAVSAPATPTHIRCALIAAVCAHGRRLDLLVKGGLTQTLTAAAVALDDGIVLLTQLRNILAGGSSYLSECYGKRIFKKGSTEEDWDTKLRDWCLTQVTTIGKAFAVQGQLDGAMKAIGLLTASAFYPDQALPEELAGAATADGALPKALARASALEQAFGRNLMWATAVGAVAPDAPEAARLSASRRAFQLVREVDRHSESTLVDVYACYVSSHVAVEAAANMTPSFLCGSVDAKVPMALRKKLLAHARKNAAKAAVASSGDKATAPKKEHRARERRALATAMIVTCLTLYVDADALDAAAQLLDSKDEVINVLLLMVQSPSSLVHDGATAAWNAIKSTVDWASVETLIRFVYSVSKTKYTDLMPSAEDEEGDDDISGGDGSDSDSDSDDDDDDDDSDDDDDDDNDDDGMVGSANEPDDDDDEEEEEEEEDDDDDDEEEDDEQEDRMDDEAMRRFDGGLSAAVALAGGGKKKRERTAMSKLAALDHAAMRVVSWIQTCVLVQRKSPLWLYASPSLARAAKVVNRRARRANGSVRKARLASAATAQTLQNALFKCLTSVSTVTRPNATKPADQAQAVRVISQLGSLLKPKRVRNRESAAASAKAADQDGDDEAGDEEDDEDLEVGGMSRGEVSVDLKNVEQGLFAFYARSLVYTVGHVSEAATWHAIPKAPWFPAVREAFRQYIIAAFNSSRLVPDSWFTFLYSKVPSLSLALVPDAFEAAAKTNNMYLRTHAVVTVSALLEDRSLTASMPASLYESCVLRRLPAALDAMAELGTLTTLRERRVVRSLRRLTKGPYPVTDKELAVSISSSLVACLATPDEEAEEPKEKLTGRAKKRKRGTAGGHGAGKGAHMLVRELANTGAEVSRKRGRKGQ